jgi:tRNA(fMet)-specific endonuclease VapC
MVTHLLDTSVYSQRLRRQPVGGVIRRWSALGDGKLAISSICEAELLFGLEKKNSVRLWAEYDDYLKFKLIVLSLDRNVIETYARLKAELQSSGMSVSEFDLLIGATALAHGLKLATLNAKHFTVIPGLIVEDWT